MRPWDDGHKHAFTYFGGMASCVHCAAQMQPGGAVEAPTRSSQRHARKAVKALAAEQKTCARCGNKGTVGKGGCVACGAN